MNRWYPRSRLPSDVNENERRFLCRCKVNNNFQMFIFFIILLAFALYIPCKIKMKLRVAKNVTLLNAVMQTLFQFSYFYYYYFLKNHRLWKESLSIPIRCSEILLFFFASLVVCLHSFHRWFGRTRLFKANKKKIRERKWKKSFSEWIFRIHKPNRMKEKKI